MSHDDFGVSHDKPRGPVFVAALLALASVVLAGAWLWVSAQASEVESRCRTEEKKLDKVKTWLSSNYARVYGDPETDGTKTLLQGTTLLKVVKSVSEESGLTRQLVRVTEEENAKTGEMTAKVTFQKLRMADLVNFLALTKARYPGVCDREARLRAARGEADSWNVTLSLSAMSR